MSYDNLDSKDLNPTESIHSMNRISRDTQNQKGNTNKKKKKKKEKEKKQREKDSVEIQGKEQSPKSTAIIKTREDNPKDPTDKKGKNIDIIIE